MAQSKWHQMTEERKQQHRDGAKMRRARERAGRTEEATALLSQKRTEQRARRRERDPQQKVAQEYKRNGKGWFYSWANSIKSRAKAKGVPVDVDAEWLQANLPTHCPVLGIELTRRLSRTDDSAASPTVDRKVPSLGYVRGNINIISRRANNIKSDASAAEILRVAQWVQSLGSK